MQGHGTVPGGLTNTTWEDWSAAVRMGARHVRDQIGADRPLVLVGYSNGGALVTKYALDALEDASLPSPAKLILLSPMIGVSPAARLAQRDQPARPGRAEGALDRRRPRIQPVQVQLVSGERRRSQTSRLTGALNRQLLRAQEQGLLAKMPPVLAFQSIVDTTVSSPAVIHDLFDHLPPGRSELVLFDLNRQAGIDAFTRPEAVLPRLIGDGRRPFAVTLVTNASADTQRGGGDVGGGRARMPSPPSRWGCRGPSRSTRSRTSRCRFRSTIRSTAARDAAASWAACRSAGSARAAKKAR